MLTFDQATLGLFVGCRVWGVEYEEWHACKRETSSAQGVGGG
ncbi:MAG: hypothetical protein PUP90_14765 [Nostoc sp. S4]|nr:hypothetical protein [Nostoc sp. S4]